MKCGKPLPAGAQFCQGCGAPVPGAAPDAGPAPGAPPPPPPPPPSPGVPLAQALGVGQLRSFLVQHQFFSNGRSYRVMSPEKQHLFTVRENFQQESQQNSMLGGILSSQGIGWGQRFGTQTFAWTVQDATGTVRANVTFRMSGGQSQATLVETSGSPLLTINLDRGLMNKLTATALTPQGQPVFQTQKNLIHHNFEVKDTSGREIAKVHEAFASARDTYRVDLSAPIDPVGPLIFAILIDREKERK
jgi:uncharacterized protein YxjI